MGEKTGDPTTGGRRMMIGMLLLLSQQQGFVHTVLLTLRLTIETFPSALSQEGFKTA